MTVLEHLLTCFSDNGAIFASAEDITWTGCSRNMRGENLVLNSGALVDGGMRNGILNSSAVDTGTSNFGKNNVAVASWEMKAHPLCVECSLIENNVSLRTGI